MKCILAGSSGLIGGFLLKELEKDDAFKEIIIIVRRKVEIKSSKTTQIIFDFDYDKVYQNLPEVDVVFCCLGTTIKIAKSKENFRKVDFQYPLKLGELVKTKTFCLVSSMGANAHSRIFYSKTKGELEDKLKKLNFTTLFIFRPSQLTGKRKIIRKNELYSEKFLSFINVLIPKNYRLIQAKTVAKAMKIISKNNLKGINIFLSDKIKQIVINENN